MDINRVKGQISIIQQIVQLNLKNQELFHFKILHLAFQTKKELTTGLILCRLIVQVQKGGIFLNIYASNKKI